MPDEIIGADSTNYIKDTIKGRQHETFETPGQQSYLEHNPEGAANQTVMALHYYQEALVACLLLYTS